MNSRPVLDIAPSPFDEAVEWASVLAFICLLALTAFVYIKMPAVIPTHFDGAGQVNSYGSKNTMLIFPLIGTVIYVLFSKLSKRPEIFNYMTTITPENAMRQYSLAIRMLRVLKLSILIIFSIIILFTYLTITGKAQGLGSWFLPFVFIMTLSPTIIFITQSLRKNKSQEG